MKLFLSVIAVVSLLLSSCNAPQQQNAGTSSKKEIEAEVKEVIYPLPTSYEVTEMLNRIGASYIITISNPASNVSKYLTEKSQALNLGVYGADLSYASTYRQRDETVNYMTSSKILIEELNISSAIDPNIVDKLEQNADNKEELVKIITDSFYSTYKYLQNNDRGGLSTIIMAGSWVEGLFIASHISEDTYNNKEIVKIILEQKKSLNKLFEVMSQDLQNPDVQAVYNDLQPLKAIYDSIPDQAITEGQLNQIKQAVEELRDKIIA